jgi:predicted nuclease of predicted toxin-antitoxin system
MRIHLDDDLSSPVLARLLRAAGHDVQLPIDVGMRGSPDSVHLTHAAREQRVCLSRDYNDFENLHTLVRTVGGHHPGILIVRRDNDPRRDLSPPRIVRAIRNLEAAAVPIADEYIILNHWR